MFSEIDQFPIMNRPFLQSSHCFLTSEGLQHFAPEAEGAPTRLRSSLSPGAKEAHLIWHPQLNTPTCIPNVIETSMRLINRPLDATAVSVMESIAIRRGGMTFEKAFEVLGSELDIHIARGPQFIHDVAKRQLAQDINPSIIKDTNFFYRQTVLSITAGVIILAVDYDKYIGDKLNRHAIALIGYKITKEPFNHLNLQIFDPNFGAVWTSYEFLAQCGPDPVFTIFPTSQIP